MIAFIDAGQKRVSDRFMLELDQTVTAVSWGVAIAFDSKGRAAHKWQRIRARAGRGGGGLTGRALESAVMAIAALDPSLVKVQSAGAQ